MLHCQYVSWCIHCQSLVIHRTEGLNYLSDPIRSKVGYVSDCLFQRSRTWSVMFVTKSCHLPLKATAVKYVKSLNSLHINLLDLVPNLGCQVVESLGSVHPLIPPSYLLVLPVSGRQVHRPPLCPRIWLELLEPGAVDSVDSFVASVTGSSHGTQGELVKRQDTLVVCIRIRKYSNYSHIIQIPPQSSDHHDHQLIPPPGHNCLAKSIRLDSD